MRVINRTVALSVGLVCLSVYAGFAQAAAVQDGVDWESFLARHDFVWRRMPQVWHEAPFLGNGMMGTLIRQDGEQSVRFDVGHCGVQDHRDDSFGNPLLSRCRLPIGYFTLNTVGTITGGAGRLNLYEAEATGTIRTNRGTIDYHCIVHTDEMLIRIEITPDAGERDCRFTWHAQQAFSTRQTFGRGIENYKPNPPHHMKKVRDVQICVQPLLVGGQTATAWYEQKAQTGRTLFVTVAHSFPETTAATTAVETIERVRAIPAEKLLETHRAWWHDYYPASFVSISDPQWESFYWLQIYKLACATRSHRALIDTLGPWLEMTPWPGVFWNLNVQLSYWPLYTGNRLNLADSLWQSLYANWDKLILNVPEPYRHDSSGVGRASGQDCWAAMNDGPSVDPNAYELCNLPWTCHNLWLHYRATMDRRFLKNRVYPLLRRSINLYLHLLQEGDDGRLHLPVAHSPEYGPAPDCNIDLALLRWGCQTLIESADFLKIDDPLLPRWREVLDKLTDYPVDKNGFLIGRGVPYAKSHRHFSHLLMIYPLYLINPDQPGSRELIETSLDHWHSLPERLAAYSYTTGASIAAGLRDGNRALKMLKGLRRYLTANTLYQEEGPCIETPLAGAQSIHDMLLQSWDGIIRIFPGLPDTWHDVAFHNLRADGAFLVSAVRQKQNVRFVRIYSLAGQPCRIKKDMLGFELIPPLHAVSGRQVIMHNRPDNIIELDLHKGEEIILKPAHTEPSTIIVPVPAPSESHNPFRLRAGDNSALSLIHI